MERGRFKEWVQLLLLISHLFGDFGSLGQDPRKLTKILQKTSFAILRISMERHYIFS